MVRHARRARREQRKVCAALDAEVVLAVARFE
jgi:hypothetical protein